MVRYIIVYTEDAAIYRICVRQGERNPVEWTHYPQLAVRFDTIEAAQATIDFVVGVINCELEGELHIREIKV